MHLLHAHAAPLKSKHEQLFHTTMIHTLPAQAKASKTHLDNALARPGPRSRCSRHHWNGQRQRCCSSRAGGGSCRLAAGGAVVLWLGQRVQPAGQKLKAKSV